MTTSRYTAADVKKAIKARYSAPEWATFFEVANGTGSLGRNYADAVAMNLFPSRGLRMHGFEIKVSRGDWLSELKNPHKSDAIQRYCNHWWIVTPADIVKDGELPPTWGHLILKGNGLNCVVKAPTLDREQWEPAFLAALLRRAHEATTGGVRDGVNEAMATERAAMAQEIKRQVDDELKARSARRDQAIRDLDEIKQNCGLPLKENGDWRDYFSASDFARAVGFVHRSGVAKAYSAVEQLRTTARNLLANVDAVMPAEASD
jgi:hypothetical protein